MRDVLDPETWSPEKGQKLASALRDAGLDPDVILVEGIDEDGYDEVQNTLVSVGNGISVFDSAEGELAVVRREWPEDFSWPDFLEILLEE